MRKIVPILAIICSLAAAAPPAQSHAGSHDIVFLWVPGCSVICPYNPPVSALGFTECKDPFPQGTYRDIVTEPAPTPPAGKKMLLVVETTPQIDWDLWICDPATRDTLAQGAHVVGDPCDNFLGPDNPVSLGCKEKAQTPAVAGKTYILRNYNFYDPADCPGKYTWVFI